MSIQKYPCADCPDCIPIGDGQGLCDYGDDPIKKYGTNHIIVDLFDIYPNCPKPQEKPKEEA